MNICPGDSTVSDPDPLHLLPDLDPANNPQHEETFFKRVHSKMISQVLQGRLNEESWSTLMADKELFAFYSADGEIFCDGVTMTKLIMDTCNPQTKVSVHFLRNKITTMKTADYQHDITIPCP